MKLDILDRIMAVMIAILITYAMFYVCIGSVLVTQLVALLGWVSVGSIVYKLVLRFMEK